VTILVIGFMLIVMLLIMVVVDVSRVFLVQRALGAAADGAAVAAAGALDEEAVYTGGLDAELPIDPVEASSRVAAYAAAAELAEHYGQFSIESVTVSGIAVTVTLRAVVHLPFQAVAPGSWSEGVPVLVTASARSPVAG
jgi:uncharacterized membrane protein